jgi:hypothetical protein
MATDAGAIKTISLCDEVGKLSANGADVFWLWNEGFGRNVCGAGLTGGICAAEDVEASVLVFLCADERRFSEGGGSGEAGRP